MTLKGLPIRYKIYLGFVVLVGVLIVISALAMIRFIEVRKTLNEFVQVDQPSIDALKDAGIGLQGAASALGYFVITRDERQRERLREQLAAARAALDRVAQTAVDAETPAAVAELRRQFERFGVLSERVLVTAASFEANYPGIAYANERINPLTLDLLQSATALLHGDDSDQQALPASLLLASADLRYSVAQVMLGTRGYLAYRADNEVSNNRLYLDRIDTLMTEIRAREASLSFEQVDALDQFAGTLAQFKQNYRELLKLHGSEQWKQDAWIVTSEVQPLLASIDAGLRQLSAAQSQRVQTISSTLLRNALVASHWVLWLAVAGVLVTALVGWVLGRMIVGPIRAACHAMAQVASGDGDLTRRLNDASRDELGELVASFNAFAERIHQLVKATARSINTLMAAVASTNDNASRIANRVIEQHHGANALAGEIGDMTASIAENARLATEGAESADAAARNADAGRAVVEETATGIQQLGRQLAGAAEAIAALDQDAQTIGGVLDVIRGIADQTNLLALNAAIEAARAGDSGRGFAVVASEVRSLANRTRESTGEIAAMISSLQTSAQETKKQMADGHRMAQSSVAQSEEALSALNSISEHVARLRASNEQIAAAATRQREGTEQIRATVERMSRISHQTAQDARESSQSAVRLGDVASELQALVGRFKLADDDSLDFEAAKSAHLAWRARARAFLDGRGSLQASEALSHRDCMLGRWYYGKGLERFGHLPGMRALEGPHAELHEAIAAIVQLRNQGNQQAAEEHYGRVIALSERIVGCLDELQQAVDQTTPRLVA